MDCKPGRMLSGWYMVASLFPLLMFACCAGCATPPPPLAMAKSSQFNLPPFKIEGKAMDYPVYVFGAGSGKPPVLLLHELPGLSSKTLAYAAELSEDFTVYVPRLFGTTGQDSMWKGMAAFALNGDWSRATIDKVPTRRITAWLRLVLARIEKAHAPQPVGIIGMCMTGDMPLALAATSPKVLAVVLAQPTLPLLSRFYNPKALSISKEEFDQARFRVNSGHLKVYGTRFHEDTTALWEKFDYLKKELAEGFCDGEIDNDRASLLPGEPRGEAIPVTAHSTLIYEYKEPNDPSGFRRQEIVKFLKNEVKLLPRRQSQCPNVPFK